MPTLLQMVHAFSPVALAHLIPNQPRHHTLHPLLADNRILRRLQRLVVIVIDTVEGGRDGRFGGFKGLGFWRRHGVGSFSALIRAYHLLSKSSMLVCVSRASRSRHSSRALSSSSSRTCTSGIPQPMRIQPSGLGTSSNTHITLPIILPLPPPRESPTPPRPLPRLLLQPLPLFRSLSPQIQSMSWHAVTHLPLDLIVRDGLLGVDAMQEASARGFAGGAEGVEAPGLVGVCDEVAGRGEGAVGRDGGVLACYGGGWGVDGVAAYAVDVEAVDAHRL